MSICACKLAVRPGRVYRVISAGPTTGAPVDLRERAVLEFGGAMGLSGEP